MSALDILVERGVVQPGTTIIEILPSFYEHVANANQWNRFRALVVNPGSKTASLRSLEDSKYYSAASLLAKLEKEEGFSGTSGVFNNWRIVGHEKSISEESASVVEPPRPPWWKWLMHWVGKNAGQIVVPVIIAVLSAVILAWLGLKK